MDSLPAIVESVKTLGFPAAVAGFVLWRVDKSLKELTKEIVALRVALIRHSLANSNDPEG